MLNGIAWSVRWQDASKSICFAENVLEKAGSDDKASSGINMGRANLTIAWHKAWSGYLSEAMSAALEVENLLSETEYPHERAHNYATLAFIHFAGGRLDLAAHAVERGLSLHNSLSGDALSSPAYVDLLTTRATIYGHKGDTGLAGLILRNAEEVAVEADAVLVQLNISRSLMESKSFEKSQERVDRAMDYAIQHHAKLLMPYIYEIRAQVMIGLQNYEEAETCLKKGFDEVEGSDNLRALAKLNKVSSRLEIARGNSQKALEFNRRAADLASRMSFAIMQLRLAREAAEIMEARKDYAAAITEHRRAWALMDKFRT